MNAKTGPAWPDRPKSLVEQLEGSVKANQCEAITTADSNLVPAGNRCPSFYTTLHPTLGKRLCFAHRCAAENFNRSTPLRFVGAEESNK